MAKSNIRMFWKSNFRRQAFEPPSFPMCMDICVVLGSKSDLPVAEKCKTVLDMFDVSYEIRVASAHRAPKYLEGIIESAEESGCKVFIGMAGVAAALPGVIASMTTMPVSYTHLTLPTKRIV